MTARALLLATGIVAASITPAFCDSVTAIVQSWDATNRTITLEDNSQFYGIAKTVNVPNLKSGDEVTVEYDGSDNGVDKINSITVNTDVAKRLISVPKRG